MGGVRGPVPKSNYWLWSLRPTRKHDARYGTFKSSIIRFRLVIFFIRRNFECKGLYPFMQVGKEIEQNFDSRLKLDFRRCKSRTLYILARMIPVNLGADSLGESKFLQLYLSEKTTIIAILTLLSLQMHTDLEKFPMQLRRGHAKPGLCPKYSMLDPNYQLNSPGVDR